MAWAKARPSQAGASNFGPAQDFVRPRPPKAKPKPPKPGQARPYLSQAEPGQTIWPGGAFGPAQGFLKPKPSHKAPARRDSILADKEGSRLEGVKENMHCLI